MDGQPHTYSLGDGGRMSRDFGIEKERPVEIEVILGYDFPRLLDTMLPGDEESDLGNLVDRAFLEEILDVPLESSLVGSREPTGDDLNSMLLASQHEVGGEDFLSREEGEDLFPRHLRPMGRDHRIYAGSQVPEVFRVKIL